ncbi:MAG: ChaN family lipoprotein [Marinibacterium sp.]|nr:ChaN family lipoprotein [Marinibacterium sp.]
MLISVVALMLAGAALAGPDQGVGLRDADVVVLGEVHDNPHHHSTQAQIVGDLAPAALVFEMLTPAQAAQVTPDLIADPDTMAQVLDWSGSGWPDFSLYHPIFAGAPDAAVFGGAVPRDTARAAMQGDSGFDEAALYGLDQPLDPDEQATREALQMRAHCDALPEDLLPKLVAIQRLRDARLAQATVEAITATGGPVVVITGNGHARRDWGMPVYLRHARPDLTLHSLGQAEDGVLTGVFDSTRDAPAVDRPDPCAAFRSDG